MGLGRKSGPKETTEMKYAKIKAQTNRHGVAGDLGLKAAGYTAKSKTDAAKAEAELRQRFPKQADKILKAAKKNARN